MVQAGLTRQYDYLLDRLTFLEDRLDFKSGAFIVEDFLDVDALPENAIAISTNDLADIKKCKDFFLRFPCVFLALADEQKRQRISDAFASYMPAVRVVEPRSGAFGEASTVREILNAGGVEALDRLCSGAIERPAQGLLDIASVQKPPQARSVLSGIDALDRAIGGFAEGEVSVWTGQRGSGKSTLVSQLALEAVERGERVCVYSGELSAWRFKSWALLQAAGEDCVSERESKYTGQTYFEVDDATQSLIDEWWKGRLLLFDNTIGGNDIDAILSVFDLAVIRYGCKVFVLDNLMSARLNSATDTDFYRRQSELVGRLVSFAKKHDAIVHIVAHPRKLDRGRQLEADDIAGSGDISNRADNCFALHRLSEEEKERLGYDAALSVLKNRAFGFSGLISLYYEPKSRRFYRQNASRTYGWRPTQEYVELPDEQTPF